MASPEEIAELRRLINEPVNVAPWTDGALSARLDARPAGQRNSASPCLFVLRIA